MLILNLRDPIVWVAIPTAADVVSLLGAKLLVYQVSDKYDVNEDSALSRAVIRDMDARLKQRAAVVMYSGRKLYEEAETRHRYFLEQAVDYERFANLPPETPPDIGAIPRPVLGYVGAADWYTMDVPLIEHVARVRPDWHWVFIGAKSNVVQLTAPNIHFLGPKPYSELPRFYRHIDVCVLPWVQHNVFTSYGSAIKVREYLATGKPVVISPLFGIARGTSAPEKWRASFVVCSMVKTFAKPCYPALIRDKFEGRLIELQTGPLILRRRLFL